MRCCSYCGGGDGNAFRHARRSELRWWWWWSEVLVAEVCCDLGEAYRVARVHEALDIDGHRLLFTRTIGHGADMMIAIA
jgi:hypothetical protein